MLSSLAVVAAFATPVTGAAGTEKMSAVSTTTCGGAISWSAAKGAVGKVATVKGRVVDAYYARASNGRPTFLNLGRAYPDPARVTILIWSENRARFGKPESRYRGLTICVRGRVTLYRGSPQIEATSPNQIAVSG